MFLSCILSAHTTLFQKFLVKLHYCTAYIRSRQIRTLSKMEDVEVKYVNRIGKPNLAYKDYPGDGTEWKYKVVYCHGLGDTMECERAKRMQMYFSEKGHPFIKFDLSDHGLSVRPPKEGVDPVSQKKLDFKQWIDDTITIVRKCGERDEHPIIFIGDGLGAWLGVHAALERKNNVIGTANQEAPGNKFSGFLLISSGIDYLEHFNDVVFDGAEKEKLKKGQNVAKNTEFGEVFSSSKLGRDGKKYGLLKRPEVNLDKPFRFVHRMGDQWHPFETVLKLVEKVDSKDCSIFLRSGGDHRMDTDEDYKDIFEALESLLLAIERNKPLYDFQS